MDQLSAMTGTRAYLDYNASAPLRPAAREAMVDVLLCHGNASSVHGEGRDMRRRVEVARSDVAALVGTGVESVVFTSSATEAAHLALTPGIAVDGTPRPAGILFVLETEHPCVLAGGRFTPEDVVAIPVLPNGLIDMDAFSTLLKSHANSGSGKPPFVAVQLANSETGIVQPVAQIAAKTQVAGGYLLCDAVQAAGRLPLDVTELGADFLLLSAHKLGGPQGAAALINVHPAIELSPAIRGGGQEKNRRAGTENVAAIAGFGAAARAARAEALDYSKTTQLRDSFEQRMAPICAAYGLGEQLCIFGRGVKRTGNTTLFAVEGLKAETALIAFDLEGIAVSSGSACSSGKVGSSHVLQAMQVTPSLAGGAIRASLGWGSTSDDIDKMSAAFERVIKRLSLTLETRISGAA